MIVRILMALMASINFSVYAKTGLSIHLGSAVFLCFMFIWNLFLDLKATKL